MRLALVEQSMAATDKIPNALLPWDNKARTSLSMPLYAWLFLLVSANLASLAFVATHHPPRWVIDGFVVSHVLVVVFANVKKFTMRRGTVSLLHLACWSPGWICTIVEICSGPSGTYLIWCIWLVATVGISFIFDTRDAVVYLKSLFRSNASNSA